MDDIDRATQAADAILADAIDRARTQATDTPPPSGVCLWCDEPLTDPRRRWCSSMCRDEWEEWQEHCERHK